MKKISGSTLLRIAAASFCIAAAAANVVSFVGGKEAQITVNRSPETPVYREVSEAPVKEEYPVKAKEDGRIDLNTATSEELQTLKGIGPTNAKAIIDYRDRYGGFTCIEEITEVKGIGEKTFEKIKDQIVIR